MNKLRKAVDKLKTKQDDSAKKTMLEELFNDWYIERGKVYKMNFIRGIVFGLGSVLGGTIVIALIIWILSLFVQVPVIGDYVQSTQDAIETTGE